MWFLLGRQRILFVKNAPGGSDPAHEKLVKYIKPKNRLRIMGPEVELERGGPLGGCILLLSFFVILLL